MGEKLKIVLFLFLSTVLGIGHPYAFLYKSHENLTKYCLQTLTKSQESAPKRVCYQESC